MVQAMEDDAVLLYSLVGYVGQESLEQDRAEKDPRCACVWYGGGVFQVFGMQCLGIRNSFESGR